MFFKEVKKDFVVNTAPIVDIEILSEIYYYFS